MVDLTKQNMKGEIFIFSFPLNLEVNLATCGLII